MNLILKIVYWPAAIASLFLASTLLSCHGENCQTAIPVAGLGLLLVTGSIVLFVRFPSILLRCVALGLAGLPLAALYLALASSFDIPGGVVRLTQDLLRRDSNGNQSLFPRGPLRDMGAAIAINDTAAVVRLAPKVDLNAHDGNGEIFIDFSLNQIFHTPNRLDVLRALLKAGADPNVIGRDLPLSRTIQGAPEMGLEPMLILLAAGADPNKEGHEHVPAYFMAANRGTAEIFKILLEHGADLHLQPKDDYLLIRAVYTPNWEAILFLLQHGVDGTKAVDPLGRSFEELVKLQMVKLETVKPPPPYYGEVVDFLRTHSAPK